MRLTQGSFSFLPDLTDEEVAAQVAYALAHGWPVSVEHTDDPHPRNIYWQMWGLPMFDSTDPQAVVAEVRACRTEHPQDYVRVVAYDARLGRQTVAMSFIVGRPAHEPGFRLDRVEGADRRQTYSVHAYATDRPAGERYPGAPQQ